MDVHAVLGEELSALWRRYDTEVGDTASPVEDEILGRVVALEDAIVALRPSSAIGAVLQLRLIVGWMTGVVATDVDTQTMARMLKGVLAAVEASAGVDRAALAGEHYAPSHPDIPH